MKYGKHVSRLIALVVAMVLLAPVTMAAQVEEQPKGIDMAADLFVARPVGIVLFALGTTTYLATLPFSLAGGNAGEAGKTLVIDPAREVFVRCLGCTRPGRKPEFRD